MSLDRTSTSTAPRLGSVEDPFRLGWRYRLITHADGTEETVQIPLTEYDLLFPEEGDFVKQNEQHIEDCYHLLGALKTPLARVPGGFVLSDHRIQFDVPDLKALGPDVAVFGDADRSTKPATLDVGRSGARSILMIEMTSPDSVESDLGIKREYYHQARSEYYAVIDPKIRGDLRQGVQLLGFRYAPDDFEPIPLDDQGRLWIEPLGIWMFINDDLQVRITDAITGRVIPPMDEAYRALLASEEQTRLAEEQIRAEVVARTAAEEQARAASAADTDMMARLAALEEELRRVREGG